MKQFLKHSHYVLILIGVFVTMNAKADFWDIPKIKTYYSENKEYKLVITPRIVPDKYYLWNHYKNGRYPQTRKILRKKERFMKNITGQDTITTPCTAELYRLNGTECILVWKRKMLNYLCPFSAIVANDGSSIATFDNWYSIGYGDNVFVIYDNEGNTKRTYKLEEISPFALNDYLMTISSLYWNYKVRYIDDERIEIVFRTEDEKEIKRIYNTKVFGFEK